MSDNDKHFDLVLEAARRTANEWFASFDRHHRTAPSVAEEALAKKKELDAAIEWFENDSVGAECSRLESDHLDIHDALVAAGLEGAINPASIIERIEQLVAGSLSPEDLRTAAAIVREEKQFDTRPGEQLDRIADELERLASLKEGDNA